MMTIRIKIIIVCILAIGFIKIINLIKKGALELKYSLTWMLLFLGLALIVLIPNLLEKISEILGIYDATNMVFFAGIVFLIIIIFSLTMSLSRNSDRVCQLSQSIALQDYESRKKIQDSENR